MEKIFVCKTTQISVGQMKKISVDGKDIVVANIGGDYFAMNDTCTHASASLSEGKIEDSTIICDWHGAQFDCKNGKLIKFPAKIDDLEVYNVVVEEDNILIET